MAALNDWAYYQTALLEPQLELELELLQTVLFPSTEFVGIESQKPIAVAQFVASQSGGVTTGAPSVVFVPPTQQYERAYQFAVPAGVSSAYVLLTVQRGRELQLVLDAVPVATTWTDIVGTEPRLMGGAVPVDAGEHYVTGGAAGVVFGAYVYGAVENVCGFAYQAGMCLADIRDVSTD